MTAETSGFKSWAIVEQQGHRTFAGLVSEEVIAGVAMLRIDIPQADESLLPKWIGPSSIFALTPCTEVVAKKYALAAGPVTTVDRFVALPAPAQVDAGQVAVDWNDDDDYDDDDDDDYEYEASGGVL
jgi:hypothetical protein